MKTSVSQMEHQTISSTTEVYFPEGIIGFTNHRRYNIIPEKSKEPFYWLQSAEDPEVSFIIITPREFKSDYSPELLEADKTVLEINDADECQIFSIVSVSKESDKITANLLAPLIINPRTHLGRQVVLQNDNFSVQHLILEETREGLGEKDVSSFAKTQ